LGEHFPVLPRTQQGSLIGKSGIVSIYGCSLAEARSEVAGFEAIQADDNVTEKPRQFLVVRYID
jgi:hypothetical protein